MCAGEPSVCVRIDEDAPPYADPAHERAAPSVRAALAVSLCDVLALGAHKVGVVLLDCRSRLDRVAFTTTTTTTPTSEGTAVCLAVGRARRDSLRCVLKVLLYHIKKKMFSSHKKIF